MITSFTSKNMNILLLSIQCVSLYCMAVGAGIGASHRIRRDTKSTKISADSIDKVRQHVLKFAANNADAIHKNDIKTVKNKNGFIERFLQENNGNEVDAQTDLLSALKYLKAENFHDIDDTYFPSELWASGGLAVVGKGTNGEAVANGQINCFLYPKDDQGAEFKKLSTKFIAYNLFKLSTATEKGGNILNAFVDEVLPNNMDPKFFLQLAKGMGTFLKQAHFKGVIQDINPKFETGLKAIITFLGVKDVVFVKKGELSKHLKLDTIPRRFHGEMANALIPKGAKSGKCLTHLKSIDAKVWKSVREQNMECYRLGMTSTAVKNIDEYLHSC